MIEDLDISNKKIDDILDKVQDIESLISRRLMEDKSKNAMINDLRSYLIYRQDLDKGTAFSKFMLEILKVVDRLKLETPSHEFNQSVAEELIEIMGRYGLRPISEENSLDPKIHKVVGTIEDSDVADGAIVKMIQQGYVLDNKVLRPSKVIVNKNILIDMESIE